MPDSTIVGIHIQNVGVACTNLFFIKYSNKKGQKYYNHTFATICESSYGNKQACKVLRNSHLKRRISCTYKLLRHTD
jgi:hypothetical protein